MERAYENLVEDGVLEPGAVLGQRPRVPEVFRGRMLDHAILDVAAFRGVVVAVSPYRLQTYPCPTELNRPGSGVRGPRGVIVRGLRKLIGSLTTLPGGAGRAVGHRRAQRCAQALRRSDGGCGQRTSATLGQRLYVARGRAKLSKKEAANGVGLRKDLIEAVEVEEPATEEETSRIKDLIAALGG